MRFLVIFFLLVANVSVGQMDDYNRLKAAADTALGLYDKVYPDTFYVFAHHLVPPNLYVEKQFPDSLSEYPEQIVYRESDSSLFNGTIIRQGSGDSYTYKQHAILYENGRSVRGTTRIYQNFSRMTLTEDIFKPYKPFDHKKYGYWLMRVIGGGYTTTYFNQNKISSIRYEKRYEDSDNSIFEYVQFYWNEQIQQYHFVRLKDGVKHERQLDKDTLGDTTKMAYYIDYRRNGLSVEKMSRVHPGFKLYTVWKNDTLIDVLNSSVLFVNKREKVISEEVFCRLLDRDFNDQHWVYRPTPERIRQDYKSPYNVVFSSKNDHDFFFLHSAQGEEEDAAVIRAFLKKNRKRIEALGEN